MPAIRVQRVTTRWTKTSRGGEGAIQRSAADVGFPWPPGAAFHDVELTEADAFQPQHKCRPELPAEILQELSLRERDGPFPLVPAAATTVRP